MNNLKWTEISRGRSIEINRIDSSERAKTVAIVVIEALCAFAISMVVVSSVLGVP
jgi:hypothetical protein